MGTHVEKPVFHAAVKERRSSEDLTAEDHLPIRRQSGGGEGGATVKGVFPDGGDVGEVHASKQWATVEGTRAHGGDGLGQGDGDERLAIGEGPGGHLHHGLFTV